MKKKKREMIESLRPHFVFNVMNVLRYMIKKDTDKACDMVYDLSVYMRCKLDTAENALETTFQKEWNAVSAYLRLEQVALPNLNFFSDVKNEQYIIASGSLLEHVEQLVKEQVRITKEPRTLCFTDHHDEGDDSIKIIVEETNVWIQL